MRLIHVRMSLNSPYFKVSSGMNTVVLVDLDGTLTATADVSFKEMKDGLAEVVLQKIPLLDGAVYLARSQSEVL